MNARPDPSPLNAALAESAWLRRLARSLTADEQRAEDALQETYVAALSQPSPVRAPRAWLARVLRNALHQDSRRRVRRERRERRANAPAEAGERGAPPAHEVAARLEVQQAVLEAVRALDEPYRTAVVRRYFDGLPPRVLAAELGVPVKTVRTRLERAIATLRRRLDRRFGDRSSWAVALLRLASADSASLGVHVLGSVGTATWVAASALAVGIVFGVRSVLPDVDEAAVPVSVAASPEPAPGEAKPLHAGNVRSPAAAASEVADPASIEAPAAPRSAPIPTTLVVRVAQRGTSEPAAGARVQVRGTEPPALRFQAVADAGGVARLDVVAGQRLRVVASPREDTGDPLELVGSSATTVAALAEGESRELVLELPHGRDARAVGRVVDAASGQPLAGATVRPTWSESGALVRRTDADGSFELAFPSWRASYAAIELDGFGPVWVSLSEARPRESPAEVLEVRLERAAALEFALLARDGTPIDPVHVRIASSPAEILQPLGASARERDLEWTVQGEHGQAFVTGLPAGARLSATLYGPEGELLWRPPAPIVLAPGEERRVVWTQDTSVHGVVRDQAGRPIADCEVWALAVDRAREGDRDYRWLDPGDRSRVSALAESDGEGRFALAGLAAGEWWIGPGRFVRDADREVATVAERRTLPDSSPLELDLVAYRGLVIEGRVVGLPMDPPPDVDGSVARPQVIASTSQIQNSLRCAVADDGSFRVGPLALDVPHELRVLQPDSHSLGGDPVLARPGQRGVELVVRRGATITGRVVDAEGRAIASHVHLRLPGNGSLGVGTGIDGTFRFGDLDPGDHVVRATSAEGLVALWPVRLAAEAQEDLELSLEPGARLVLALEGSRDRLRCEIVHEGIVIADFTLRRGHPATESVPPGPVLVQVYSEPEGARAVHAVRSLRAAAGETYEVILDVR